MVERRGYWLEQCFFILSGVDVYSLDMSPRVYSIKCQKYNGSCSIIFDQ